MIRWWVALWDRREAPTVLALVRIGVGLVLLSDFLITARLRLVEPLMTSAREGGLAGWSASTTGAPPWFQWVGDDATAAWGLWTILAAAAAGLCLGLFSRTSAAVLMFASAQWAWILPDADRGIDVLLRNVLMVLAFSRAGDALSLDARWTTGSFAGSGALVPAWPRYLLILQIVVMYFTAGVQKYAQHWWPWGGYAGLYVVLQDWAVAAHPFGWLRQQPFYALTQLSTAITMLFQWSYPVVLLHYFPPAGEPGRFRRAFARWRLHWAWIAVGAWFHLALAATMELGIFPWGMLALYWVFLHPDELDQLTRRVRTPRTSAG